MNKDELIKNLRDGVVMVEFLKKDGSIRAMKCTLNENKIPTESAPKGTGKKTNDNVLAVYDIENNGWRSFRFDSIISHEKNNSYQS